VNIRLELHSPLGDVVVMPLPERRRVGGPS
jgi:hypothetical protein